MCRPKNSPLLLPVSFPVKDPDPRHQQCQSAYLRPLVDPGLLHEVEKVLVGKDTLSYHSRLPQHIGVSGGTKPGPLIKDFCKSFNHRLLTPMVKKANSLTKRVSIDIEHIFFSFNHFWSGLVTIVIAMWWIGTGNFWIIMTITSVPRAWLACCTSGRFQTLFLPHSQLRPCKSIVIPIYFFCLDPKC